MTVMPDLTGQRFGRWVAEEYVGKNADGHQLWKCQCDCGNSSAVDANNLRSGASKSCGCLHRLLAAEANRTHGMYGTPLHTRWLAMLRRATNPNQRSWANYGGRGITVCDRWREFTNFAEDMGPTFSPELQLDRIDNESGYFAENCRWATTKEQSLNRRSNHRLEFDGLTLTIQEWSERLGIKYGTIHARLKAGCSVERALQTGRLKRRVTV